MIMGVRGAVAPVVYGGKLRRHPGVHGPRTRCSRAISRPTNLLNAINNYNIFLPTGGAKFGTIDYALDSNSMYELVDRMGEIPVRSYKGNVIFLKEVGHPQGRQPDPDEHRARQTVASRSTFPSIGRWAPARCAWSTS